MLGFSHRTIGVQLVSLLVVALLLTFLGVVVSIGRMAENNAIEQTERELKNQLALMSGSLDGLYKSVQSRGERQSQFYANYTGAVPQLGTGKTLTGKVELPTVLLGQDILNGNLQPLENFKKLTGDEASYVMLSEGKVYRLAVKSRLFVNLFFK